MANFTLDDGAGSGSISVNLVYHTIDNNTWTASTTGMLPADSGTWTSSEAGFSSGVGQVILLDGSGIQMLQMDSVPVHAHFGYPFDPKDVGMSGGGVIASPIGSGVGATTMGAFGWTLISA